MKFSLLFEMQLPAPTRCTEASLFHECLEQAVLADSLGYHCVWAVEHHGLLEYSHSSAPEIFLSFVAARTQRIRVGHGVTLLPGRYNHPIRVAERVATLDILSNGRVSWGTGKSASLVEQEAFACDIASLHDEWLEALQIIPRMWNEDVFEFKGKFYNIPPTQVIPKPVQAPHPPMFGACSRPESVALVGRLGLGALNFGFGNDAELGEKVRQYRAAVADCTPVGRQRNNHFACAPAALVLDSDREACAYGMRGARFFVESMMRYYLSGTRPTGSLGIEAPLMVDAELEAAMQMRNAPGSQLITIVGDPTCARESVQRYKDLGVDELMLIMQLGTVPHELVLQSLKTFAEKVMPHFA